MRLSLAVRELHPRRVFRIARARRNAVENVFVRIEKDGICGYGEASPNAFYNETAAGVLEKLQALAPALKDLKIASPSDIENLWDEFWQQLHPSRAAQCAIDLALWDWLAKARGISVAELAWGMPPKAIRSFCTIGISSPDELKEKVDELLEFPAIKIKSDATADLTPVRYVRERLPNVVIAVDANCAWGDHDLGSLAKDLAALDVAFIEQPVPPDRSDRFRDQDLALPVVADESCVTESDVSAAVERYNGFNIKLVKCGGLTPGLRMARRGAELGATMMIGCMLESSALIAAAAVIAQQTDYADLDGAWLLGDDPFNGLPLDRGTLKPSGIGLGVEPDTTLFD
jgi:L-alanine-DL-glutamate epimerase-like enolase superfamily enzyme